MIERVDPLGVDLPETVLEGGDPDQTVAERRARTGLFSSFWKPVDVGANQGGANYVIRRHRKLCENCAMLCDIMRYFAILCESHNSPPQPLHETSFVESVARDKFKGLQDDMFWPSRKKN